MTIKRKFIKYARVKSDEYGRIKTGYFETEEEFDNRINESLAVLEKLHGENAIVEIIPTIQVLCSDEGSTNPVHFITIIYQTGGKGAKK